MTGANTKIIEERWMPAALTGVPPTIRAAIAVAVDYRWAEEETDYLDNCSNEPGDNQRGGHPYEALALLRRWLEGNVDGLHVDTDVWTTNPEPGGGGIHYLLRCRRKTIREVFDEVAALVTRRVFDDDGNDLGFTTVDGAEEYFSPGAAIDSARPWPQGRTVVFPVTGGSEGWYIHVEVIGETDSECVILGKTLDSADAAWTLARRLAVILGV
jgi:hypothetical protein